MLREYIHVPWKESHYFHSFTPMENSCIPQQGPIHTHAFHSKDERGRFASKVSFARYYFQYSSRLPGSLAYIAKGTWLHVSWL